MMRMLKNLFKAAAFCVCLFLLLSAAGSVLKQNSRLWGKGTGLDLVCRFPDQYQLCFVGTSTVIASISNQELYERYGIASVSVGEPEQPVILAKYTIDEVLRHQHPRAVVLDSRALFYEEEILRNKIETNEETVVHSSLDPIRSWSIRKEALDQIRNQYKKLDYKDYFFDWYRYHSRWKELSEADFQEVYDPAVMNGNVMMTDLHVISYELGAGDTISAENEQEVQRLKDACAEHGADLILMTGYLEPDLSRRKAVRDLAKKHHIDYIDFNDVVDEIGFEDWMINDYIHFNVVGAAVWSDYLGQYFTQRYSFDSCSKALSRLYRDQSGRYADYLNYVNRKHLLAERKSFKPFLRELAGWDPQDVSIFVAAYDDAYHSLDEEGRVLLQRIGLDGPKHFRDSYAGACTPGGVFQKNARKKKVTLSGKAGDFGGSEEDPEDDASFKDPEALEPEDHQESSEPGNPEDLQEDSEPGEPGIIQALTYTVESAGINCEDGAIASIFVNGQEYAKGQRGLNIVVMDNRLGRLIASVCFDTYSEADPEGVI